MYQIFQLFGPAVNFIFLPFREYLLEAFHSFIGPRIECPHGSRFELIGFGPNIGKPTMNLGFIVITTTTPIQLRVFLLTQCRPRHLAWKKPIDPNTDCLFVEEAAGSSGDEEPCVDKQRFIYAHAVGGGLYREPR
jgi:hypothetical protein